MKHPSVVSITSLSPGKWIALLMGVAFLVMLPPVFIGLNVHDEGYYLVFYDNLLRHPECVASNFTYYLSGVAGALLLPLAGYTLLGMRLWGVVCNMLTLLVLARWLDASSMRRPLLFAAIAVGIGTWGSPACLNYDTLTPLFGTASLCLLSRSLGYDGGARFVRLTLVAGLLAGINLFVRIPNVLEYLFVLIIPTVALFPGAITGRKRIWARMGLFTAGWVSGIALVLLLAFALGHIDLLRTEIMRLFVHTASADRAESTHTLGNLWDVSLESWKWIGWLALRLFVLGTLAWIVRPLWGKLLLLCPAAVWVAKAPPVRGLGGICLAALAALLIRGGKAGRQDIRTLALASLFYILLVGAGSDGGIYNAGTQNFWLPATAAMWLLCRRPLRPWALVLTAVMAISWMAGWARTGLYWDPTPPQEATACMTASRRAAGVRTSVRNAERMDRITALLQRHCAPGDTLLVFDSAPMLNFLTQTVPGSGTPWPAIITSHHLRTSLEAMPPRSVAMVRFNTMSSPWGEGDDVWQSEEPPVNTPLHNVAKVRVMRGFLDSLHYRRVALYKDFELYRLP